MSKTGIQACLAFVILGAVIAGPLRAQIRTFDAPLHDGLPVSYCGTGSATCGERMAAVWCRSQGYEYASTWAARAGIDATSRAVRLDDGGVCQGAQCESFAEITCGREAQTFTMPVLGAAANATVLSPSLRTTEASLETSEFRVLIPGCVQQESGIFVCESIYEYQHCRTLMVGQMVHSCRASLDLAIGVSDPYRASPEQYELDVESDARVRIMRGSRGFGQIKGKADVTLAINPPIEDESIWCLQRDRYIYFPTGPEGGIADVSDTAECEDPIEFSFEPHDDDLLRAYDLCDAFDAWGGDIKDSIEVLAASLFHVRSAQPEFVARHPSGTAIFAPFVSVEASLAISCRD